MITFHSDFIEGSTTPRVVVTGHMVDRESRLLERFPERQVAHVRQTLQHFLGNLMLSFGGPFRLITSGTKGTDLLAIEYMLEAEMPTDIYLPLADESTFLARSVNYGQDGPVWLD